MDYKQTKIGKFFLGKGFYGVLALCLAAVGAAAWSAFDRVNKPETTPKPDTNSQYIASSEDSKEDDTQVGTDTPSDIPYSSDDTTSDTQSKPNTVATSFVSPMGGGVIKPYSEAELVYSATFSDMRTHLGLDIAGEKGCDVRSCGNGFVSAIIEDKLLGKYIEIDHGNGVVARYCGLDAIYVEEGDAVTASTCIGTLGEIPQECKDATHLHLEFYSEEFPDDPEKYFG